MSNGVTTVGAIDASILARMDRTGSEFVPQAVRYDWINKAYKALYDLLIQKFGNDYFFADPYVFTTDGISDLWALPDDFYKFFGLDLSLTGGTPDGWITVKQFTKAERNRYAVPNFQSFYGISNVRYRLRGNKIWLTPLPAAGQKFRVIYAPRPTDIVDGSSTIDGVSGWEEMIELNVCIKYCAAEETDASEYKDQWKEMRQRIEEAAENRNVAEPQTVSDNSGNQGPFGGYSGGGGYMP